MSNSPKAWLAQATEQLTVAGIATARLDAELILAHVLGVDRTWLIAHDDESLPTVIIESKGGADSLLRQRLQRIPLAYLLKHKEFYGRTFIVTPDVLIPRPESETVIDILTTIVKPTDNTLLDVGTGSGCLAITAKLESPQLSVTACDISPSALKVAQTNATQLGADISCTQSDLLAAIDGTFEHIIANLPYVARTWMRSPETDHEPSLSLFAEDDGLSLIYQLIAQAPQHMTTRGYLLIEADPRQHDRIATAAAKHTLATINRQGYVMLLQKTV